MRCGATTVQCRDGEPTWAQPDPFCGNSGASLWPSPDSPVALCPMHQKAVERDLYWAAARGLEDHRVCHPLTRKVAEAEASRVETAERQRQAEELRVRNRMLSERITAKVLIGAEQ